MATLRETVEAHGYSCDRHSDWEHAIPGICLQYEDDGPCPDGRTVIHVYEMNNRWFVIGMALEDLLPLLGLAVAAGYGAEDDE